MFDLAVAILKTKLTSYRTAYAREHNLLLRSIQAGGKLYKPKYEHFDRLNFLRGVVKASRSKEDGSSTIPHTESAEDPPTLQDLEELQDLPVYNSPPGHNNDDDNDVDESLSCDLSCENIPDDKLVLQSLLEQNGSLSPGHRELSSEQHHEDVTFDEASLSSLGPHSNTQLSMEAIPQGADQELFSPLFQAQSSNKNKQNAERQNSRQRSRKRRRPAADEDGDSEDADGNRCKRHRQEGAEGQDSQVLHNLMSFLLQRLRRREKRRRKKEEREGERADASGDELWAKQLVQQINEITSEKKRQLLKLKISQMVIECRMEELDQD